MSYTPFYYLLIMKKQSIFVNMHNLSINIFVYCPNIH